MHRFVLLLSCLASVLGLVCSPAATAQGFPAKSISIVVPYPPGSTSDLIPRLLAPLLSQALAVPVLVENLAGANGALGAQKVEKGGTEELQILMAPTGVLAINQFLYTKLAYDPEKAFEPVINLASTPNLIVVNKDVPAASLQELIQLAKNRPGSITYASAGIGSTSHLCGEMLRAFGQAPVVHVPYRGPAPAKLAVLSGEVSMICDNLSNVIQEVRSGRLKAIALTARSRHPQAADIPTTSELGLRDIDAGVWYSLVVRQGTPRAVINRLNSELVKAIQTPAVRQKLAELGLTIVADSPEAFALFLKSEVARWKHVVTVSGAKAD